MTVIDNSALGKQAMLEGKPPKVIRVYYSHKQRYGSGEGTTGCMVLVAIKGQKKRGYVTGTTDEPKPMKPRFDNNNLVLIDDNGNPLGTRILAPIPNHLRSKGPHMAKIIAIASKFV